MSGMKNLANAIANDPSFAKQTKGIMSPSEAKQFVSNETVKRTNGVSPSAPKPRSY